MKKLPLLLGALALIAACNSTAEPRNEPSAEPVLVDSAMEEPEVEAATPAPAADVSEPKPEVRYYLIADA